jgi:hypothetical protein
MLIADGELLPATAEADVEVVEVGSPAYDALREREWAGHAARIQGEGSRRASGGPPARPCARRPLEPHSPGGRTPICARTASRVRITRSVSACGIRSDSVRPAVTHRASSAAW